MTRPEKEGKKDGQPFCTEKRTRTIGVREIIRQVEATAGPVLASEGLDLLLVEYRPESRGQVLRLYVDRDKGVTLEDCVFATRHIGDILDVFLGKEHPYHLEVTSPGDNRPLTRHEHFNRFRGKRAVIRTRLPMDGRKKFTGVLRGTSDGLVTILCDNEVIAIPIEAIASARLHPQHGENSC